MEQKKLVFEKFVADDIKPLTVIMKRSFDEDSKRFLNKNEGGPDGYDNGNFLKNYAMHKKSDAYKILLNNKLVGCTILWIRPDNVNILGCLFVDSDAQDKGLGLQIWQEIEKMYPETKMWKTETPGFSKRNHNFYVNKCGFCIYKIVNPGNFEEESYLMKKIMN